MDPGEALDDDSSATQEPRLQSCVFSTAALTVVLVSKHDPVDTSVPVLCGYFRNSTISSCLLVFHLVHLLVLSIDCSDEKIVADVLQVTSVLEPRSCCRDVICGALADNLDQYPHVKEISSNPLVEWTQQLKSVGGGRNINHYTRAVGRGVLIGIFTRSESIGRQTISVRIRQLQFRSISSWQAVGEGVEVQGASQSESYSHLRTGDETMSCRVGVIPACEVPVVTCDDGVLLPLGHILSIPLSNTRSTSVSQHNSTKRSHSVRQAIPFNSGSDLFTTGGDVKCTLGFESLSQSLFHEASHSTHVLV